jgi:hypothetical protein
VTVPVQEIECPLLERRGVILSLIFGRILIAAVADADGAGSSL